MRSTGFLFRLPLRLTLLALMALLSSGCKPEATYAPIQIHPAEDAFSYFMLPNHELTLPAPRHITVDTSGRRLILDTVGRLLIYDNTDKLIRKWWMPATADGRPESVCVLQDGRIAVADTHYQRVLFFNYEGELVQKFGRRSPLVSGDPIPEGYSGDGDFVFPVAIVQDLNGDILVSEYGGQDRIQRFALDGKWVSSFGSPGIKPGQFQRPAGMVLAPFKLSLGAKPTPDKRGTLVIADAQNQRVQAFTMDGEWLWSIPEDQASENARKYPKGLFDFPYDVDIDEKGRLWVAEWGAGRVTEIDLATSQIRRYGNPGKNHHELRTPWSLARTNNPYRSLLMADTGNRRLIELKLK